MGFEPSIDLREKNEKETERSHIHINFVRRKKMNNRMKAPKCRILFNIFHNIFLKKLLFTNII